MNDTPSYAASAAEAEESRTIRLTYEPDIEGTAFVTSDDVPGLFMVIKTAEQIQQELPEIISRLYETNVSAKPVKVSIESSPPTTGTTQDIISLLDRTSVKVSIIPERARSYGEHARGG